jgi:hypothetical protein
MSSFGRPCYLQIPKFLFQHQTANDEESTIKYPKSYGKAADCEGGHQLEDQHTGIAGLQ